MRSLITFFLNRSKLVNGMTVILTLLGLMALWGMKRDLHPPLELNYVRVSLSYPAGSAEEVERLITYPVEESLKDLPQLEEMTSKTSVGTVQLTLKFQKAVRNVSEKIEEIRGRIQTRMGSLPSGVRDVQVTKMGGNEVFLASLAIAGVDVHHRDQHQFLERLKSKIEGVRGVSRVYSSLRPFHLFVRVNLEKLAKNGVTISQLRSALRSEFEASVIGYNSVRGKDWLLEYAPSNLSPEAIQSIPLFENTQGFGLKVGDVAEVQFDLEKNDSYEFLLNGSKAVEFTLYKNTSEDAISTFEKVKEVLAREKRPEGVDFKVIYDGPYFIEQQIKVLASNGLGGLLLVLVMLTLTMGWRSSLMTVLGLPISYFGSFLVLKWLGISIDLISMIAMILVVGNLVDDAVIFADRYNQLLMDGRGPKQAARQAANELIVPVSGTIATIICAFVPILFVESELSMVFLAIPVVIGVSLFLSWFETFFVLPNHLYHFVKKPSADRATRFFETMATTYRRVLRHTLRFRYLYGFVSLLILGFSLLVAFRMPQDFSLSLNAPQVEIFVQFKGEPSLDQVQEILKPLHQDLIQSSAGRVDFVETNVGWIFREGKGYKGPKFTTLRLVLDKKEVDVRGLRSKVLVLAREALQRFKSPEVERLEVVANERGAGSRRHNLARIEIHGRDDVAFRKVSEELLRLIPKRGSVGDSVPPENHGPMTYQFQTDATALRSYGITREELAAQVQLQTGPVELMQTRAFGRWFKIFLEPETVNPPHLEELESLQVQSPRHGDSFPMKYLGQWIAAGFSEAIDHQQGTRIMGLDFRFDGSKTNEQVIKSELESYLQPLIERYPSLEIKVVDANEQDQKGREWTGRIILLAGVLIYFILALTLGSWTQPLIVGLPIPFALIGVIWALKLHGLPLGLMAMIGLIGTMGVAVNDSIVMVHQINLLWRERNQRSAESIIDGAASRLRAIFLTASCTLLGVFPTAYGWGGESGFTQPLAFAMGWGLSASLLLTLFIIPAMLLILEDGRKVWRQRFPKGLHREDSPPEPSFDEKSFDKTRELN